MAAEWRKDLTACTFRGVVINLRDSEKTGPQRLAPHEYPGRNTGWTESLGRGLRSWSVRGFVGGDGQPYTARRDALEEALDAVGAGELRLPTRAPVMVNVTTYNARESTDDGGMAFFDIEFLEAGQEVTPEIAIDAEQSVASAVTSALSAVATAIDEALDLDLPNWGVVDTIDAATAGVDAITDAVTGPVGAALDNAQDLVDSLADLEDAVTTLIETPATLAAEAQAILTQIADLGIYRALTGGAGIPDADTYADPLAQTTAGNVVEMQRMYLRSALGAWADTAREVDWASADEAEAEIATLNARLAAEAEYADDDTTAALTDLRGALADYVSDIGARLPRLLTIELPSPVTALALSQSLYGDGSRSQEIVDRNDIINPAMCVGSLRVLSR